VDENTYITLASHEKRINFTKKEHENRVREMLYSRGIDDDEFMMRILNKTSDVVQEQKIKINKEK
jgi:hypothetical protein